MQGVVAAPGQFPVDGDEGLHAAHLAGDDDAVVGQAQGLGRLGALQGGADEGLAHDRLGGQGIGAGGVLVHEAGQEGLVEAAPVDADAHRLVVTHGGLDEGGELLVALGAAAHVARVDAQLGEGGHRLGVFVHQAVAVEVEVAHQGHGQALGLQARADLGQGGHGRLGVDGDAHQFGAGAVQLGHLGDGGVHVGGVGVGHGLHHHRGAAAEGDALHVHRHRGAAREGRFRHGDLPWPLEFGRHDSVRACPVAASPPRSCGPWSRAGPRPLPRARR